MAKGKRINETDEKDETNKINGIDETDKVISFLCALVT